jgi:hypothetical protein
VGETGSMAGPSLYMPRLFDSKSTIKRDYKKRSIIGIIFSCVAIIGLCAFLIKIKYKNKNIKSFCGLDAMLNESFYIELSSNATSYNNNTIANFKNDITLLRPLEGSWEIGLVEISYTKSWKNLQNDYKVCLASERKIDSSYLELYSVKVYEDEDGRFRCGMLKAGNYESIKDLVSELNSEMKAINDPMIAKLPRFFYNKYTKRVYLFAGSDIHSTNLLLKLGKELKEILGFTNYSTVNPEYKLDYGTNTQYLVGDRPADLDAALHTLYVYCDIIEPQYIGDIRARLIRSVEVPSNYSFGEQVVVKYENPHYVPLIINDFEHIEIDIKDDTNERIPFLYGRTRIKLHLRKKYV